MILTGPGDVRENKSESSILRVVEVIICTRFGLYSVRTDSAQFLTFELVHSFCLFFDLLASRDEVDQDFISIMSEEKF